MTLLPEKMPKIRVAGPASEGSSSDQTSGKEQAKKKNSKYDPRSHYLSPQKDIQRILVLRNVL